MPPKKKTADDESDGELERNEAIRKELLDAKANFSAAIAGVQKTVQQECANVMRSLMDQELKPMLQQVLAAKASEATKHSERPDRADTQDENLLAGIAAKLERAKGGKAGRKEAVMQLDSLVASDNSDSEVDRYADEEDKHSPAPVRLAPAMLQKIKRHRSATNWVRFQKKWDNRSLHEAEVLAQAADAYLSEPHARQDSLVLEILLRRLCALRAVEDYGDWDIADVMSWDSEGSLLPRTAMQGFIKQAAQVKALRKSGRPKVSDIGKATGGYGRGRGRGDQANRGGRGGRGGGRGPAAGDSAAGGQ